MALFVRLRMTSTWKATVQYAALVVLVPTILLLLAGKILGSSDPFINLDLITVYLVGIVASRVGHIFGFVLSSFGIFFVISIQLLMNVGLIYIDDPALISEYLQFARYWPWGLIAFSALPLIASICILCICLYRTAIAQAKIWPAGVLLIALLAVEFVGRTGAGFALIKANPTTSSVVRSFKMLKTWANSPGFSYERHPGGSMSSELTNGQTAPARILSISVEALGLSKNSQFNSEIMAPLGTTLGGQYSVKFAAHDYKGATLAGELRELCGLRISGTPTRAASQSIRPFCLPARLGSIGYQTTAIHGNSRFFYNRGEMYKAIGFKDAKFYEALTADGASICKTRSFSGVCDAAVMDAAFRALASADKSFVHVMTLQTHFPLSNSDVECVRADGGDRNLCSYKLQFTRVVALIADGIARAKVKPDLVYIYGDHAPPYVVASERSYFDRQHVPFVVLTRRQDPAVAQ